ncbi:MAG TPA: zinc-dependent metalloprotease [Paludibacteraceae bacterium]|nr:zinc-dependent metalloprotease [Paludibacteraceae bacterium]
MKRILSLITFFFILNSIYAQVDLKFDSKSTDKTTQSRIHKCVKKYKSYKFDKNTFISESKKSKHLKLNFGNEYIWNVELEKNNLLSNNFILEYTDAHKTSRKKIETNIYKGKTSDGKDVRFTICNEKVMGVIIDEDGKKTIIRESKDLSNNQNDNDIIVYDNDDVIISEDAANNKSDIINVALKELKYAPSILSKDGNSNSCSSVLEIATDADYEFYLKKDSSIQNVYTEIMSALNLAEAAYERAFGLTFSITYQHIWTSNQNSNYPYGTEKDDLGLLESLKDYWNANMTSKHRDLVHLFTGNSVYTYGIAYCYDSKSVVGSNFAYSLSYYRNEMYQTTTHELGHNLGAKDANIIGYTTECECYTSNASVMCQGQKSSSLWFCQKSIEQISAGINSVGSYLEIPNLLNISQNISEAGNSEYDAVQINANNVIYSPSIVKYKASSNILLKTGFKVKTGAKFKGSIYACNGNNNLRSFIYEDPSEDDNIINIEEEENNSPSSSITLFPNPTKGIFNVRFGEVSVSNDIIITNIAGKVVLSKTNVGSEIEVDLTGNAKGVYFVKLSSDGETIIKQIILM